MKNIKNIYQVELKDKLKTLFEKLKPKKTRGLSETKIMATDANNLIDKLRKEGY